MKTIIDNLQDILKPKKYGMHIIISAIIFILLYIAFFYPSKSYFCTLAGNALLVGITYIYVLITNKILREEQKKREIEFIQRQLEYFYYPLLRTIKKALFEEEVVFETKGLDIYYGTKGNIGIDGLEYQKFQYILDSLKRNNIEELFKYKYLSSVLVRDKFQKVEEYLEESPFKYEGQEYADYESLNDRQETVHNTIRSLEEDLKSEIEDLNSRLIDLIN